MTVFADDRDRLERLRFGRRWRRRLLLLAVLVAVGWLALTGTYFRNEIVMGGRLLWLLRADVALEYAPPLAGLFGPAPVAAPAEAVLRAKVPRPVAGQVSVADVLIGNTVRQLSKVVPLVLGPALLLLAGGYLVAAICGRLAARIHPGEVGRLLPVIAVPALFAFGAGAAFGAAALHYRQPILSLLGF